MTYEIEKSWLGLYFAVVIITFIVWYESILWICIPEDILCSFWGPITRIWIGLFLSMFTASRGVSIKKVDPWYGRLIAGVIGNLVAYVSIVFSGVMLIHPNSIWSYLVYHRYFFAWYVGVPLSVWILWCILGWFVQHLGLVPNPDKVREG